MALAKERNSQNRNMVPCSYYGNAFGKLDSPSPPIGFYSMEGYHKVAFEGAGMEKTCSSIKSNFAPDLIDMHGGGSMLGGASSSSGDSQSVLEFKNTGSDDWAYSSGSLLSFEQGDHLSYTTNVDQRSMNSFQTAGGYGTHARNPMDKVYQHGEERFMWLRSGAVAQEDCYLEPEGIEGCYLKRAHPGGDVQSSKKKCTSGSPTRKPKPKPAPTKDPQSVAAKNRRERISERLKILQDLIPNGTKVDLVTMLEKAISYVKFLQLQAKVLATDEFWPAAGGKAPEVAQVKEAIDAILSSYKDRSSSSK